MPFPILCTLIFPIISILPHFLQTHCHHQTSLTPHLNLTTTVIVAYLVPSKLKRNVNAALGAHSGTTPKPYHAPAHLNLMAVGHRTLISVVWLQFWEKYWATKPTSSSLECCIENQEYQKQFFNLLTSIKEVRFPHLHFISFNTSIFLLLSLLLYNVERQWDSESEAF